MNQDKRSPFRYFIVLHKVLIKKMYLTDLLFIVCGLVYLVIRIPEYVELFRAGIIAFLIIIFFTALNMRIISVHMGSTSFYRLLPLHGVRMALKIHGVVILPVLVFSVLGVALIFLLSRWIDIDSVERGRRVGLVVGAFFTVKCMALPTLLILRKSILALGAFYVLIIPLLLVVSIFNEFFFSNMSFAFYLNIAFYMILLFGLEMWVAVHCKS